VSYADLLYFLHATATAVMLGVVWYAQLIRYPSFNQIPADQFAQFHRRYTTRIGFIVAPAMIVELWSGFYLLFITSGMSRILIGFSLFILALIWISTAFVQVPCHNSLSRGFQVITHRRLVATNWYRTIGWTLRAVLIIAAYISSSFN